jgi:hypothetical protein
MALLRVEPTESEELLWRERERVRVTDRPASRVESWSRHSRSSLARIDRHPGIRDRASRANVPSSQMRDASRGTITARRRVTARARDARSRIVDRGLRALSHRSIATPSATSLPRPGRDRLRSRRASPSRYEKCT